MNHLYFCSQFFTKKYSDPLPSVKTKASQWLPTSCFAAAALSKLGQASVSSDTLTNSLFTTCISHRSNDMAHNLDTVTFYAILHKFLVHDIIEMPV